MIRTYEISATRPAPWQRGEKLPVGPTDPRDPAGQAFVAQWLGHVAAGRIGGNTPINEEARAIVLANERLMFGDRRGAGR